MYPFITALIWKQNKVKEMNIKAVIHAVQQRANKTTTIVRRATKFSPEQRRNTTLSQAVVEVVNDSQNGTPISSSNIMSISANNTCVKDFLDDPLQETFDLFDPTETLQIKTAIDMPTESVTTAPKPTSWEKLCNKMQDNRSNRMRFLMLKDGLTIKSVTLFQKEYWAVKLDPNQNTTAFLKTYRDKPTYTEQITVVLLEFLEQNNLGHRNSKLSRDNIDAYTEAVNESVDCLKIFQDFREKFRKYSDAKRFDTVLLDGIKQSFRSKTKPDPKPRFDKEKLGEWKEKMTEAKKLWPKWYKDKVDASNKESPFHGQAIFDELDNMEGIIDDYIDGLEDQSVHDKERRERDHGRTPSVSNTVFTVISQMP